MHIRKSRRKFAGPMYLAVSILTLIGWLDAHEILAQTGSGAIPRILKKGALCIEGNEVEGEGTSSYKATGFAVATIGGQSSKLEGDSIVYDKTTRTLEAKGHARLFRDGSETKADRLSFVVDAPNRLVTEPGTVVSEPSLVTRRVPMSSGDASKLGAPVEGPMIYQRQIVCNLLKAASKAGLDVTDKVRTFESIEERVKKGKQADDFQAELEMIRQTVSAELGQKQLLVDQYYGNGPLTKLCDKIAADLRKTWQKTPGFEKLVYLFFVVQPNGKITDTETDDPVKYGPATSATAIERVKSLNLSTPAVSTAIGIRTESIPIVLSLSNNTNDIVAYVRHLNNDTYLAATTAKMRSLFNSLRIKEMGKMTIRVLLSNDGTIGKIAVMDNGWTESTKQVILTAIRKLGKVSPFPDGAARSMEMEFTFSKANLTSSAAKVLPF